jgi:glc operon protein GlcG
MRQLYHLSHADAMNIVSGVQAELDKDNLGATVAVVDEHGELIALVRTDNCPLPSINNAINKAFTAARQGQETRQVGQSSREKGWPMTNFGDLHYIGWGGGVPIVYQGQIVGAIGISGLPEEHDMKLAKEAVEKFLQGL